MRSRLLTVKFLLGAWLAAVSVHAVEFSTPPNTGATDARVFAAQGVVEELQSDRVVIRHGAISNYMSAMTMPYQVADQKELAGIHPGDKILFQLHVTKTESWVDQIVKIGTDENQKTGKPPVAETPTAPARNPLLDYKFTNELGQAVSLGDFHGQALAITFIYTRCPLPDYCPRLSKNFQEASQKLEAMAGAPTNWHFLSFSFDTEFDTPATLKAYGESYQYDPGHWSLLTGPADEINALAQSSDVTYQADGAVFNHNFRTLIINAAGHLQMVFPTSGNLSDAIAAEIIKAAAVTNQSTPR
jgi:protein SCO1/2